MRINHARSFLSGSFLFLFFQSRPGGWKKLEIIRMSQIACPSMGRGMNELYKKIEVYVAIAGHKSVNEWHQVRRVYCKRR